MKVVMQRSCVTSVKGVATSLVRGKSYDLAEDVAKNLVAGGLAEKASKRTSGSGDSTQSTSTADTTKTAESKPKQTRKRTRKAPSKSQGAAPENK